MTHELPRGWSVARLESLVGGEGLMTDGDWVESKDQDSNGDVRLIQLADIGDGSFLDKSNRFLTRAKAEQLNCTFLQHRDVLISRLGEPLGKTCLFADLGQPCVTVVDVHVVRPASSEVNREWLVHFINSPAVRRLIDAQSSGTTRKRITGQKLKDLEIPVPPAQEQQRIASKVAELFSRIDEGEHALERVQKLVERYRQSVLKAAVTGELTREWRERSNERLESGEALLARILKARREAWEKGELHQMKARGITPANDKWKQKYEEPSRPDTAELPDLPDGWTWASLDMVADVVGGITVDQKRRTEQCERVPYLRVANVQCGYLDLGEVKSIAAPKARIQQLELQPGDILFNEGGDIDKLGRGWIWEAQLPVCIHQNHVFRARLFISCPLNKIISWYGNVLGRQLFMALGKQTTNLASLSLSKLKAFPVPVMSPAEADEIVSRVDDMLSVADKQAMDIKKQASNSSALRQRVLKAAFCGQLVRQELADEPASSLLQRVTAQRGMNDTALKRRRTKRAVA